ncbi:nucleoside/nucleotide kinase family protein [Mesorhizobium sp. M0938]|uniref:nucleoside/nucleotide kinase family protein n=1 Tax=unclassified Mesorhizobium TaxID=325217 RepID=UPI00333682F7
MNSAPFRSVDIDLPSFSSYLRESQGPARRLVAIAGAPGSGKSAFANRLRAELNTAWRGISQIVPMDGFHFDDRVLEERGDRARKGAPHTFDVNGLLAMLDRLRADDGTDVAIPVFDRALEISRAGAEIVSPSMRIILVEGNYLLLDDPKWAALMSRFDVAISLSVPRSILAERLTARWQSLGLCPEEVLAKVEANDLRNADLVIARSRPANFVVRNF